MQTKIYREQPAWLNYQRPTYFNRSEYLIGWTRRGREILYWDRYGLVCPDEATTNGSVYALMSSIARPVGLTNAGAAWFVGYALFSLANQRPDWARIELYEDQ